jgi:LysR family transcriptional activator of nhaA
MNRLNYQHLFYFWNVVKEGSISRACEKLHLAQPTISGQLAVFEQVVGAKLYIKDGRKLVLSDTGRTIFRYAEEIFSLGQELNQTLQGLTSGHGLRLNVGVADALPKLIAYRLLEPALHIPESVQIICHEDKAERLMSEIPLHSIDLVLSDIPATPSIGARVFNHLLGECELAVFGVSAFYERYASNFPSSLNGAPLLMPTQNTALRRSLDQWLHTEGLCPEVKAEIEDSALLKTFASAGVGMFVAPTAVQTEIQRQYGCQIIGIVPSLYESFYAITAQRKLKHPAVMAILENTNNGLFL